MSVHDSGRELFFFLGFDVWLADSMDAEPTDMEG